MIRKTLFWLHLVAGVAAGVFIFIMAATGIVLSFERQTIAFADRGLRSVSIPPDAAPRPMRDLLSAVRRSGLGEPTAISVRHEPQAATQFSIDRNKTVYVDPFSGAVLGTSSAAAHDFFFAVERLHRGLGAPLGSKTAGHWLAAISNLMFAMLIAAGIFLWLTRKWNWKTMRAALIFRGGLAAKAREWNWHNVFGIWCAVPLLVIVLSGVVMSFEWANSLLFAMAGSPPSASARDAGPPRAASRPAGQTQEPDYDRLFTAAKALNPDWRTITLNVPRATGPLTATVDTGTGGQPQNRTQYLLHPGTAAILRTGRFSAGSLGQRLRAFVRFGHTGEYFGGAGQAIAALASFGACMLVYTGLSLSIRRLAARNRRRYAQEPQKRTNAALPSFTTTSV